jgi:hypothetical protein
MKLGLPVDYSPYLEIQGSYEGTGEIFINGTKVKLLKGIEHGVVLCVWDSIPNRLESPILNIEVVCTSGHISVQGVSCFVGADRFDDKTYWTFPVYPKGWCVGEKIEQNESIDCQPVEPKHYHSIDAGSKYKCTVDIFSYYDPLTYILDNKPGAEFFEIPIPYK